MSDIEQCSCIDLPQRVKDGRKQIPGRWAAILEDLDLELMAQPQQST